MIMKKPTTEAIMDAQYQAATDWKKGPHDYVGHFVSYRISRNWQTLSEPLSKRNLKI